MIKAVIFDMYETLITLFESTEYTGTEIAEDMGLDEALFRSIWDISDSDRATGKVTLEEVIETIMNKNHCYNASLFEKIIEKRIVTRRECFNHMHPEIMLMLSKLKEKNIKVGLISNCFSEEARLIRESILFPCFDAIYLSFEQGVQKPDKEIFVRCMAELEVLPEECVYVGDGGSCELEASSELGMNAMQAAWYLKEGVKQPVRRKPEFIQLETPCDVLEYV